MVANAKEGHQTDRGYIPSSLENNEKGKYIDFFEKAAASGIGCFGGSAHYWKLLNKKNVPNGSTIYDLCCGQGQQFLHLSDLVGEEGRVIGADIVPSFINEAKRYVKDLELDNVDVYLMDCCKLEPPFADEGADIVLALETVGCMSMEDTLALLDESSRLCKTEGTLLISGNAKEYYACYLMTNGKVKDAEHLLRTGVLKDTSGLTYGFFSGKDLEYELSKRDFESKVIEESFQDAFGKKSGLSADMLELTAKNIAVAKKICWSLEKPYLVT
jgi:ubiquinone/menaquinone biosynthesis C-methylase UbiE